MFLLTSGHKPFFKEAGSYKSPIRQSIKTSTIHSKTDLPPDIQDPAGSAVMPQGVSARREKGKGYCILKEGGLLAPRGSGKEWTLASIHALLFWPQGRALCFHFIQLRFFQPHQWHFLISQGSASELSLLCKPQERAAGMHCCACWGGEGRAVCCCGTEAWQRREAQLSCLSQATASFPEPVEATPVARTPGNQKFESHCAEAESGAHRKA